MNDLALISLRRKYRVNREQAPGISTNATTADLSFARESLLSEAVSRINARYGVGDVEIRSSRLFGFGLTMSWQNRHEDVKISTVSKAEKTDGAERPVKVSESYNFRQKPGEEKCHEIGKVP